MNLRTTGLIALVLLTSCGGEDYQHTIDLREHRHVPVSETESPGGSATGYLYSDESLLSLSRGNGTITFLILDIENARFAQCAVAEGLWRISLDPGERAMACGVQLPHGTFDVMCTTPLTDGVHEAAIWSKNDRSIQISPTDEEAKQLNRLEVALGRSTEDKHPGPTTAVAMVDSTAKSLLTIRRSEVPNELPLFVKSPGYAWQRIESGTSELPISPVLRRAGTLEITLKCNPDRPILLDIIRESSDRFFERWLQHVPSKDTENVRIEAIDEGTYFVTAYLVEDLQEFLARKKCVVEHLKVSNHHFDTTSTDICSADLTGTIQITEPVEGPYPPAESAITIMPSRSPGRAPNGSDWSATIPLEAETVRRDAMESYYRWASSGAPCGEYSFLSSPGRFHGAFTVREGDSQTIRLDCSGGLSDFGFTVSGPEGSDSLEDVVAAFKPYLSEDLSWWVPNSTLEFDPEGELFLGTTNASEVQVCFSARGYPTHKQVLETGKGLIDKLRLTQGHYLFISATSSIGTELTGLEYYVECIDSASGGTVLESRTLNDGKELFFSDAGDYTLRLSEPETGRTKDISVSVSSKGGVVQRIRARL